LADIYWSVRRELFEHRSIYIAPAAAAGVALFGFLINTVHLPAQMRAAIADPAKMKGLSAPFEYVAAAIMMVAMIVQLFYCLDSLQSERKDRSILFWKSLPVSDVTTVLAKATIPFAILPLLSFGVVVVAGFVMLLVSSFDFGGDGLSAAPLWTQLYLVRVRCCCLSPDHRACAVVCADLCMADVCIGVVTACRVAVGRAAAAGHWIPGKDCVRHVASWRDAAGPRRREHGGGASRRERCR